MSRRRARRAEAHVRLYRHELESPAYRSLSPDARALLVELRALFRGEENKVFMSIAEIMRRCGIGRWRAERARDELLDRGFVRLLEPASFNRKVRHAPAYALTNEPENPQSDGSTPSKEFMSWRPPGKFSTVLVTNTDGAGHQHWANPGNGRKQPHGAGDQHREARFQGPVGVGDQQPDSLPRGSAFSAMLVFALQTDDDLVRFKLCWAATLLAHQGGEHA